MMCNKLRFAVVAAGVVSFATFTRPSLAVPNVFFDRDNSTTFMTSFPNSLAKYNQFVASLSGFGVDTIDAQPASTPNPTLTFGTTGITATTQGVLSQSAPGFMIGSQALLELEAVVPNSPAIATTFDFNRNITAFGLYVIQGGDGANNNLTTFRLKNTVTNAFFDVPIQVGPGWGTDNAFFLGISDTTPFNEVQILEATDLADGMLYDNIVAGNAVPEPASFVLMLVGSVCAIFARSRRA